MTAMTAEPPAFTPEATVADPSAEAWLRAATLRLRREVSWRWRQRGVTPASPDALPPADPAARLRESLDLLRYWEAKQAFFRSDVTASYLSAKIDVPPPAPVVSPRGSFSWVLRTLDL